MSLSSAIKAFGTLASTGNDSYFPYQSSRKPHQPRCGICGAGLTPWSFHGKAAPHAQLVFLCLTHRLPQQPSVYIFLVSYSFPAAAHVCCPSWELLAPGHKRPTQLRGMLPFQVIWPSEWGIPRSGDSPPKVFSFLGALQLTSIPSHVQCTQWTQQGQVWGVPMGKDWPVWFYSDISVAVR